jgi:hypothetical protein
MKEVDWRVILGVVILVSFFSVLIFINEGSITGAFVIAKVDQQGLDRGVFHHVCEIRDLSDTVNNVLVYRTGKRLMDNFDPCEDYFARGSHSVDELPNMVVVVENNLNQYFDLGITPYSFSSETPVHPLPYFYGVEEYFQVLLEDNDFESLDNANPECVTAADCNAGEYCYFAECGTKSDFEWDCVGDYECDEGETCFMDHQCRGVSRSRAKSK